MKSLPTFTFILILISVINTSSKAQKNLKETIPKEAFFVGSVQLDKLEKDISWQKIMSYNFIEPTIESFGQEKKDVLMFTGNILREKQLLNRSYTIL